MSDKLNKPPQPELSERDAELLSAYIDDMLEADARANLETRLATDDFLRHELTAMRQTVLLINQLPTLKAPRNFTISAEDVAEKSSKTVSKVIPMQNRNWWLAGSAAAAMLVLFFGALVITQNGFGIGASFEPVPVNENVIAFDTTASAQDGGSSGAAEGTQEAQDADLSDSDSVQNSETTTETDANDPTSSRSGDVPQATDIALGGAANTQQTGSAPPASPADTNITADSEVAEEAPAPETMAMSTVADNVASDEVESAEAMDESADDTMAGDDMADMDDSVEEDAPDEVQALMVEPEVPAIESSNTFAAQETPLFTSFVRIVVLFVDAFRTFMIP